MDNLSLTLIFVVALGGCAATGDWNQDSLFFDHELADKKLGAQRAEVEEKRARLAGLEQEAASLEQEIDEAKRANAVRADKLKEYKRRIESLTRQLAVMKAALAGAQADTAARTKARAELQRDVDGLEARVGQMRHALLILLENS